jgi:hypothetical protein
MKRLIIPAVIAFVFSSLVTNGQDIIPNTEVTGFSYAGKNVKRIYIPPPDEYMKKGSKGGGNITVYYTGFSAAAQAAFEYAISILESLLPSGTNMTVLAKWESQTNKNILGNSTITGFAAGWSINALDPLAYYPMGLAEKIAGGSLNTDPQGDIVMSINSNINWYLGTDGQTPPTKYDLVTVVIHEMCHGLGFFDSMNATGQTGTWGLGPLPIVFDKFVENESGQNLVDTTVFKNNSNALYQQYVGGNLYFSGPLTLNYNTGIRPKLYSPATFDNGSSISHLDEETNKDNPLMTPFIDLGEAIHNPGKLTMSMLGDLGWVNTRIIHKPSGDTEEHLTQVPLSIDIKSDTTYNRNEVGVIYSFDNFKTNTTSIMTSPNSNNTFRTVINIPSYNTDLQYYFFVEDKFLRRFEAPSFHDAFRYATYIGTDTIDPVMYHTPVKYCLQTADNIDFKALAFDNIGVDSLYLEYRINDGPAHFKGFIAGKDNEFDAVLKLKEINAAGGDSVHYRIFAIDSAKIANVSVLPVKNYYSLSVERIESVVESYSTDFLNASADFFNVGFTITQSSGFNRPGLNSKHPYESPGVDNASIDYTAMLRHPVKFDESGLLVSFSEVVLVEPGEAGSVFGSTDFYDYVIVEASKDFGNSWIPLTDGYDSRYLSSWEKTYNLHISNNNSTSVADESMLQKHTIYYKPTDKISANDTLLVRFRLYSDPYANGWGWIIQDLSINALINSADKTGIETILLYPNPGNGLIKLNGIDHSKPFRYSIMNSTGNILVNGRLSIDSDIIDISSYPSGLYFIVINSEGQIVTTRYVLMK